MNITAYFTKDLFQNQTVFITGGSSGINLGIAHNFAAVGANLGLCRRSQDKLDAASAETASLLAQSKAPRVCADWSQPVAPTRCRR